MPFEELVEITRILEAEAEGNLLDGDSHLLEAHASILNHSVIDERAWRLTCIAHAASLAVFPWRCASPQASFSALLPGTSRHPGCARHRNAARLRQHGRAESIRNLPRHPSAGRSGPATP